MLGGDHRSRLHCSRGYSKCIRHHQKRDSLMMMGLSALSVPLLPKPHYLLTRASLAAAPDPAPSAAAPASTPVAEPVTEVREPTTKPAPVAEPAPSAQISCKKYGEAQRLTGSYGKYGYYVKCEACGANTSMRQPCIRCGSKDVKVMKKRQEYWATCSCSDPYLLFTQPRSS